MEQAEAPVSPVYVAFLFIYENLLRVGWENIFQLHTLKLNQQFSAWDRFVPHGKFGNVWRHFGFS